MALRRIKAWVERSPAGKRLAHRALFPKDDYRPRWWVRALVNPLVHTRRGKIRGNARLDTVPFNTFVLMDKAIVEGLALVNNVMGEVIIGRNSLIGYGSVIIGPVVVDDDVLLAQNVVLSALNHNYEDTRRPIRTQGVNTAPIHVGKGSWIGAHAVVLPGVSIGTNCVIAAGAVVTKDVPDYAVAVGTPARVVRRYDPELGSYARWRERAVAEVGAL